MLNIINTFFTSEKGNQQLIGFLRLSHSRGSEENQFAPPSPSRSRFGGARLGLG
jgi:hypothetical protein